MVLKICYFLLDWVDYSILNEPGSIRIESDGSTATKPLEYFPRMEPDRPKCYLYPKLSVTHLSKT